MVRKRTAYSEEELEKVAKLDSLVIMFKHYVTFERPITYEFLLKNNIVKGPIQGPLRIDRKSLEKIIKEGHSQNMFEIM